VDFAALADNSLLGADIEEEELDEEETLVPADGEAAREAFRALLDLSSRPPGEEPAKQPANGTPHARVNPALQKRILEYSQAGMAVSDIARELGIGKGEVRLMLSLAKPGQS
jgi:DNA-binding NarL/FixJ family response regulator